MSDKTKAMLLSFLRVLLGCFVTAYTAVVGADAPWNVNSEEWLKIGNALWGAAVVTGVNFLRSGETRFGVGSKDLGMGGDDVLEPPTGQIAPESLEKVVAPAVSDEVPVQTDNGPKDDDDVHPDQGEPFTGEMR